MNVHWLSEDDVKSLLTMDDTLEVIEKAFRDHGLGLTQMPSKSYLDFPKYNGDLRTMPAYLEGLGYAGVKIVNSHPGNPANGLPTIMVLLVLNSPVTGVPLAVMGATTITAMKTGAAGAIAAKYLARPESSVVGLVGAGIQAQTQLLALSKVFNLKKVIIADISMERAKALEAECRKFLNCEYQLTTDAKDACDCDILVTTTPSRKPVVMSSWVKPGTHINAIGADAAGKQELETALTKRAKLVVDEVGQAAHSGEINVPIAEGSLKYEDIYSQIGMIVAGKVPGRTSPEEVTIFDSTGLAIQDVATAATIYNKALAASVGTQMKFF
jgi:alanine dehydrogenase